MISISLRQKFESLLGFVVIFGWLGAIFGGVAGLLIYHQTIFLRAALSVSGEVIELTVDGGVYKPTIKFVAQDSKTYKVPLNYGSNPPGHRPGEVVNILYDPTDPYRAEIDDQIELWFLEGLFSFFAVIFLGIAGGIWWADRRQPRPTPPAT